jgi:predicted nucleotidyltransferase
MVKEFVPGALDILPIGEIEDQNREVVLSGKGGNLQTLGMQEVYDQARSIEIDTHFQGKIATIPQICLLKLVSYGNNPERRNHDKEDILVMARQYFEMESDLVYDQHFDILEIYYGLGDAYNHQVGGHVLGREIQAIAKQTPELIEKITQTVHQLGEKNPGEEVWKCLSAGIADPNCAAPKS